MKQNTFYKLFPPPSFLKMQAIGLDISDESIHFIQLLDSKNGTIIGKFGEKKISKGIIESGEIKKKEELVKILKSLKSNFGSVFVNASLPEQHAYLLKVHIPKIKKREIRSNLELHLEDNVPISASEAVFDYDIICEKKGKESHIELELSVLPKAIVENYLEVFKEAGLMAVSFEIEAQAIARAVVEDGDKSTVMVVDFGKTRTGISIISEGKTRFTSTVDIGGSALTSAIEKTLKLNSEEAEKIKKEKGIIKREENEELFLTMMSIIGILKEETNKHYIYWHTHKDQYGSKRPKIEKIILCGGDSNLPGLADYLSSGLRVPVELANVMINVNSFDNYIPEFNFVDSLRYSTAIGLALRQYNQ
jgi:type IV pilus assembly protein PilM